MRNERFWKNRLLDSTGFENFVHCGWPVGQTTGPVNAPRKLAVCDSVDNPAGRKFDVVTWKPTQFGFRTGSQPFGGWLAPGATVVSNSTPAVAVLSFDTTVLLMKSTFTASCSETPPPSQPATLFAKMLLVISMPYHFDGVLGLRATSLPLTCCSSRPPPLPSSAVLPWNRLALITRPGPVPSLKPGGQSASFVEPHSVATPLTLNVPSGPWPSMIIPPP